MFAQRTTRRWNRSGISLIEVMFAVGVAAIGLAGVIAVLPMAMNLIRSGHVADNASRAAMNAVEQFHTRGMVRPDNWVAWHGANPNPWEPIAPTTAFFNRFGGVPGFAFAPPLSPAFYKQAFVIDPQFVAANVGVSATNHRKITFPYPSAPPQQNAAVHTDPRMMRISVLSAPLALLAADTSMPKVEWGLTEERAETIFVLQDDLVFAAPQDDSLPPAQFFSAISPGAPSRRDFDGRYTWMATITPKIDSSGFQKDLYNLSVVVFLQRDPRFAMFEDADADGTEDSGEVPTYNESVVNVVDFPGAGYRGGDVVLSIPSTSPPEALNVKRDDWLMLMGWFRPPSATPVADDIPLFRWYRVIGSDSEPELVNGGSDYVLNVTLDGADWPFANMTPVVAGSRTKAAIVQTAVAVFERTIRLERSTLF